MPDHIRRTAMAADIVSAFVSNNHVRPQDMPQLIRVAYDALAGAGGRGSASVSDQVRPAVTVRKSLAKRDRILSMIDGRPYASLKRHLVAHGLTFEEYRARYSLPATYPRVAPGYTERRRAIAIAAGLGTRRGER